MSATECTSQAAAADGVALNERMITPEKCGVTAAKGREQQLLALC